MTPPLILLAHGAGAGSSHPWMQAWAQRLEGMGVVHTFDHAYIQAGKRLPPRADKLVEPHAAELARVRAGHVGPVVLAGKSMGSRVGCHVATQAPVDALVCFGYPLRSPAGTLRDAVLREITTPILFVQGTRDRLCPLDLLAGVRADMTAPNALHVVEGGDHSLQLLKRDLKAQGTTQDAVDAATMAAVAAWLEQTLG